ncbi:MAG TPA: DUF6448 family protein [Spirochaetota bacterium]|nr:DUF6448 family protein [Spirochaetota bacterium]
MIKKTMNKIVTGLTTIMLSAFLLPGDARAHCDTLDGPVILAAKKALDEKNVNRVLIWVQKGDEKEINGAFSKALAERVKDGKRETADREFFETLVKVHRAGEGAPFTGLKPAGEELNPAVEAADKSIENGKIDGVSALLAKTMNDKVNNYFFRVTATRNFAVNDVQSGREFVRSYVEYVHYVEGLYNVLSKKGVHHEEGGHGEHAVHGAGHGDLLHNVIFALAGLAVGMAVMYGLKRGKST